MGKTNKKPSESSSSVQTPMFNFVNIPVEPLMQLTPLPSLKKDKPKTVPVTSPEDFAKEVLPKFFKHNNVSSFVRQLNMYGFHKVPNQSGIFNECVWKFSHPEFIKGKPELLSLVKRKNTKEGGELDLVSVIAELSAIRQQQTDIGADLNVLQRNNQLLWNEVFTARERYLKQQDTIDKLLKFLASIFSSKSVKPDLFPKRRRLLIEEKDSLELAQEKVKELFESEMKSRSPLRDNNSIISLNNNLKTSTDKAQVISDEINSLQDNIVSLTESLGLEQEDLNKLDDLEFEPDFLKIMGFDSAIEPNLAEFTDNKETDKSNGYLICHLCKNKYHQDCTTFKQLPYKIIFGDEFYIYKCSKCSPLEEELYRSLITPNETVMLCMHLLTVNDIPAYCPLMLEDSKYFSLLQLEQFITEYWPKMFDRNTCASFCKSQLPKAIKKLMETGIVKSKIAATETQIVSLLNESGKYSYALVSSTKLFNLDAKKEEDLFKMQVSVNGEMIALKKKKLDKDGNLVLKKTKKYETSDDDEFEVKKRRKKEEGASAKVARKKKEIVYSNRDFDRPNLSGSVKLCKNNTHSDLHLTFADDFMTVSNDKGYRMAKATHSVEEGNWYYELEILPSNGNVRAGWAQILADPHVPVGYDEYAYGIRDKEGTIFHCSLGKAYGETFHANDVMGFAVELPPFDSSISTVEILKTREQEYPPLRYGTYTIKQDILVNSKITFYKNGKSLGSAFTNIYRGKYFPAISLFNGGSAKVNFGPDFQFAKPDNCQAFCDAMNILESYDMPRFACLQSQEMEVKNVMNLEQELNEESKTVLMQME